MDTQLHLQMDRTSSPPNPLRVVFIGRSSLLQECITRFMSASPAPKSQILAVVSPQKHIQRWATEQGLPTMTFAELTYHMQSGFPVRSSSSTANSNSTRISANSDSCPSTLNSSHSHSSEHQLTYSQDYTPSTSTSSSTTSSLVSVDYIFSVYNHWILDARHLSSPFLQGMILNLHDGPLPRYAGANAVPWALANGESTHAVTWHVMQLEVDEGAVVAQQTVSIEKEDTTTTVRFKLLEAAIEGFRVILARIEAAERENASNDDKQLRAVIQDRTRFLYHPRSEMLTNWGLLPLFRPPSLSMNHGSYPLSITHGDILRCWVHASDFGENDANVFGAAKLLLRVHNMSGTNSQETDLTNFKLQTVIIGGAEVLSIPGSQFSPRNAASSGASRGPRRLTPENPLFKLLMIHGQGQQKITNNSLLLQMSNSEIMHLFHFSRLLPSGGVDCTYEFPPQPSISLQPQFGPASGTLASSLGAKEEEWLHRVTGKLILQETAWTKILSEMWLKTQQKSHKISQPSPATSGQALRQVRCEALERCNRILEACSSQFTSDQINESLQAALIFAAQNQSHVGSVQIPIAKSANELVAELVTSSMDHAERSNQLAFASAVIPLVQPLELPSTPLNSAAEALKYLKSLKVLSVPFLRDIFARQPTLRQAFNLLAGVGVWYLDASCTFKPEVQYAMKCEVIRSFTGSLLIVQDPASKMWGLYSNFEEGSNSLAEAQQLINVLEASWIELLQISAETKHQHLRPSTLYQTCTNAGELFLEQARLYSSEPALHLENSVVSYGELKYRATQLAYALYRSGLKLQPGSVIVQVIERGVNMEVGMLAIQLLGCVYCPLSPSDPLPRVENLLADVKPVAIFTDQTHANRMAEGLNLPKLNFSNQQANNHADPYIVRLDDPSLQQSSTKVELQTWIPPCMSRTDLDWSAQSAYLLFTSGSNGTPKAVCITHGNLLCHLQNYFPRVPGFMRPGEASLGMSACSFDVHVLDQLAPLLTGGSVRLVEESRRLDMEYISSLLGKGVQFMIMAPSLLLMLVEHLERIDGWERLSSMRGVICGGELMPVTLLRRIHAGVRNLRERGRPAPPIPFIFHSYGPAECTLVSTSHPCFESDELRTEVPIGPALAHYETCVLTERLERTEVNEVGMLYIGGPSVFKGYWQRPELTASAIVSVPALSQHRLYCTGDLVRVDAANNMYFVGRSDFQLKLRGMRLEAGEIEAVFRQHEQVINCIAMKVNLEGEDYLCCYVQVKEGLESSEEATLPSVVEFVTSRLTRFMWPSLVLLMPSYPLTPNGKVDRRKLPTPTTDHFVIHLHPSLAIGSAPVSAKPSPMIEAVSTKSVTEGTLEFRLESAKSPLVENGKSMFNSGVVKQDVVPAQPAGVDSTKLFVGIVAKVWSSLFPSAQQPQNEHADFFLSGGTSILTMRYLSLLQVELKSASKNSASNWNVSIKDVLKHRTISQMASFLQKQVETDDQLALLRKSLSSASDDIPSEEPRTQTRPSSIEHHSPLPPRPESGFYSPKESLESMRSYSSCSSSRSDMALNLSSRSTSASPASSALPSSTSLFGNFLSPTGSMMSPPAPTPATTRRASRFNTRRSFSFENPLQSPVITPQPTHSHTSSVVPATASSVRSRPGTRRGSLCGSMCENCCSSRNLSTDMEMSSSQFPMPDNRIAIIGMAGQFPNANSVDDLWANISGGVDCIKHYTVDELVKHGVPLESITRSNYIRSFGRLGREGQADPYAFDAEFFGFSAQEAAAIDPQHRLFLQTCYEGLLDAGIQPAMGAQQSIPQGEKIGLFAGVGESSIRSDLKSPQGEHHHSPTSSAMTLSDQYRMTLGSSKDFLCTRVAHKLGLNGPCVGVQTACSTSLVAVHMACQSLQTGDCTVALAGGVSLRDLAHGGYDFEEGMIHSADGHCRPFDQQSTGTVPGQGVAVVVLKTLAAALRDGDRVNAVILASSINNDGSDKASFAAPSVAGQVDCITEALRKARVDPQTIGLVEAHGTGTAVGDTVEMEALTAAFRQYETDDESSLTFNQYCVLSSVKSQIGHLDAAAGVTGLIKAALCLKHETLPPTLHFNKPHPHLHLDTSPFTILRASEKWVAPTLQIGAASSRPRRAAVTALGMGSTNCHMVLEQFVPSPTVTVEDTSSSTQSYVLCLSAHQAGALRQMTIDLLKQLQQRDDDPAEGQLDVYLQDLCCTYQYAATVNRLPHRRAWVVKNRAELKQSLGTELQQASAASSIVSVSSQLQAHIVFAFPGQGSQYIGLGLEAFEKVAIFRTHLQRSYLTLREHARQLLEDDNGSIEPNSAYARMRTVPTLMEFCRKTFPQIQIQHSEARVRYDEAQLNKDVRALLQKAELSVSSDVTGTTMVSQLVLFLVQHCLAQTLIELGVKPTVCIGHSLGQYVAAVVSDVWSVDDAVALIMYRGAAMEELMPPGRMMTVRASQQQCIEAIDCVKELASNAEHNISIAAVNSPSHVVVSGDQSALEQFQSILSQMHPNSICKFLHVNKAFHSQSVEPFLKEFESFLDSFPCQIPSCPLACNVTGTLITPATSQTILTPQYWVEHTRAAVQFQDGLNAALRFNNAATGPKVVIEIGSGNASKTFFAASQTKGSSPVIDVSFIGLLPPFTEHQQGASSAMYLTKSVTNLWQATGMLRWDQWHRDSAQSSRPPRKIAFPRYSFQLKHFEPQSLSPQTSLKRPHRRMSSEYSGSGRTTPETQNQLRKVMSLLAPIASPANSPPCHQPVKPKSTASSISIEAAARPTPASTELAPLSAQSLAVAEWIRDCMAEVLQSKNITLDTDFFNAGGDSLLSLALLNKLRSSLEGAFIGSADQKSAISAIALLNNRTPRTFAAALNFQVPLNNEWESSVASAATLPEPEALHRRGRSIEIMNERGSMLIDVSETPSSIADAFELKQAECKRCMESLVQLKAPTTASSKDAPILFLVHAVGGDCTAYHPIVARMEQQIHSAFAFRATSLDQLDDTTVANQSSDLNHSHEANTDVRALAVQYLTLLLRRLCLDAIQQSKQRRRAMGAVTPILLPSVAFGGHSFGGVVAFEMARLFEEMRTATQEGMIRWAQTGNSALSAYTFRLPSLPLLLLIDSPIAGALFEQSSVESPVDMLYYIAGRSAGISTDEWCTMRRDSNDNVTALMQAIHDRTQGRVSVSEAIMRTWQRHSQALVNYQPTWTTRTYVQQQLGKPTSSSAEEAANNVVDPLLLKFSKELGRFGVQSYGCASPQFRSTSMEQAAAQGMRMNYSTPALFLQAKRATATTPLTFHLPWLSLIERFTRLRVPGDHMSMMQTSIEEIATESIKFLQQHFDD